MTISKHRLNEVESELTRLQGRIRELRKQETRTYDGMSVFDGSDKTAAVRRASLDLTKALAKMRKGDRQ